MNVMIQITGKGLHVGWVGACGNPAIFSTMLVLQQHRFDGYSEP